MEFLNGLNDMQKKAVQSADGPLLVLAGAGSGKTTVLVNRIGYILETRRATPYEVLAITFTNKAAGEMKERLAQKLRMDIRDMWVGTFHSICCRILRREIDKIGYDRNFVIFDTTDQKQVLRECLKELDFNKENFPLKSVSYTISKAKNIDLTPELFLKEYANDYQMKKYGMIYELYQKKLKSYNAVDFDDLLMLTVKLLKESPEALEYYSNKFKYILVDEYQDTNKMQFDLVRLLSQKHGNICAVGDDDQSIYKFRGADISIILSFEKAFQNANIIKLEQNYRSTKSILNAANEVIKNNRGRKPKVLWTENETGDMVGLKCCDSEWDEGYFIASTISDYKTEGKITYPQCAVLYRTNAQSRVIEDSLMKLSVPYRIYGGLRFYDRKEIKDILSYLRLIGNSADNVSFKRIINVPKRGIGAKSLDTIEQLAILKNTTMFDITGRCMEFTDLKRCAGKLIEFYSIIQHLKKFAQDNDLTALLREIYEKTGYVAELERENTIEAKSRIENINEFLTVSEEYLKTAEEPSLDDFLEKMALLSDADNYDENAQCVTLMTLHASKGLEFDMVFLAGMEDGLFPSSLSIMSEDEIEEERRLCYVGITRARKYLFLSYAQRRTIFGKTSYCLPSRFLDEIPSDMLNNLTPEQKKSQMPTDFNSILNTYNIKKGMPEKKTVTEEFQVGERVRHKKFGEGLVLNVQVKSGDTMLEIAFDKVGTKTLSLSFAPVEHINAS